MQIPLVASPPLPSSPSARGFLRASLSELCAVLLLLAAGLLLGLAPPARTTFYERDLSLSKERFDDTIPPWLLVVLAVLLPACLCLAIDVAAHCKRGRGGCVQPHLLLGLALAITSTLLATDALKNFIGSKRPNFFDLCNYAGAYSAAIDTHNTTSPAWQLYDALTIAGAPGDAARCTAPEASVQDAMRSFPSGHSSLSFAGLGFLVFVLRGALGVKDGVRLSPAALASGAPLAIAAFVAATRVRDNWHREIDITAGAALGCVLASAAWGTVRARAALTPLWAPGKAEGKEGERGSDDL